MDDHTLSSLEFYDIVSFLKGFASSTLGRKECEKIRPLYNLEDVEMLLTEVTELKELLERGEDFPLHGMEDIEPILQRIRLEGAILTPEELLKVAGSVRGSISLKRFLRQLEARLTTLKKIGEEFCAPAQLVKEIEGAIGPGGEIYDEATQNLKAIRGKITKVRNVIQERLELLLRRTELRGAFQDEVVTHRNNRYVILIRADFKGKVKGIVHDYSHSMMSVYVEPIGVVELNNELNALLREEQEEEEKILRRLTSSAREHREGLINDLALQGRVDAIYAKARFSLHLHGVQPALNIEGRVKLINARHPLLIYAKHDDQGVVVPIDLYLDSNQKILVISGANTGGKTAALKTLGLLSLMVQAGLHIPVAADSEVTLFQNIFAYVGDEQNLQEHLSTFSSFIQWLNRILNRVNDTCLLLIDEIGVGTEYSQGAALAMGLLDYIRNKGGYAVVTSHFNPLKVYAYRHKNITNVAVEFDQETLKPTYRLHYGRPGTSQTFLIAERLGLEGEILDKAKGYQEEIQGKMEHIVGELEILYQDIQMERAEMIREKEEMLQEREQLRHAAKDFQERRRRIIQKTEEEGKRIVSSLETRLKEVVKKVEERKKEVSAAKGEFKHVVKEDFKRHFPTNKGRRKGREEIKEGDWVEVLSLGKEGMVVGLFQNPPRAEVSIGGMRINAPLEGLRFVSREEGTRQDEVAYQLVMDSADVPAFGELNVVGLRADEALPKVDKFLDDALLRGWETVHIIHGIGSGRLKEVIQGHLTGHRWVKEFRGGELNEGGLGVTVVELR
jgi:DNA mismatch repair protein MutS2